MQVPAVENIIIIDNNSYLLINIETLKDLQRSIKTNDRNRKKLLRNNISCWA